MLAGAGQKETVLEVISCDGHPGDVLKGSKVSFCETVVILTSDMMIPCGRSSPYGLFFVAGAVPVDLSKTMPKT
jgi:hypothetical protein